MFGSSMFGGMRNDPFSNTGVMSEFDRMDRMMADFHRSFGMPSMMQSIEGPTGQSSRRAQHPQQQNVMPFGGSMFGQSMFANNMESMFSNNPNTQCYSSSRIVSFSNDGGGQPKYYEATSETTQGPHGVRQTQRSERNSETGLAKMAVGHHIYDRGHVVERSRNRRTNEKEEKHDFLNMDEEDKDSFHREWEEKARPHRRANGADRAYHRHRDEPRAINSAEYHRQNLERSRARRDGRHVRISNQPDEI